MHKVNKEAKHTEVWEMLMSSRAIQTPIRNDLEEIVRYWRRGLLSLAKSCGYVCMARRKEEDQRRRFTLAQRNKRRCERLRREKDECVDRKGSLKRKSVVRDERISARRDSQITKDPCNRWGPDFANHKLPPLFSCLLRSFLRLFFTRVATNRYRVLH